MNNTSKIKIIGQIVDTLKTHIYFKEDMTVKAHFDYSQLVETLKSLKDEAQAIHHNNSNMRFVNHKIGSDKFQVMATTFKGFQVTIKNQDVTISLKVPKIKDKPKIEDENKEVVTHTHNPIMKVEFRASFLARVGHYSALDYINNMISKWIIEDYNIKISEIHLATDIQGYHFTELDYYRFQTRKRTNVKHLEDSNNPSIYYAGRVCTGFSFGKGDEMLRIYNKSIEITKNADKRFVEHLVWSQSKDYDKTKTVWRIEVQYRREKLKTIYTDKDGFLDGFENVINAIPELWGRALEVVVHKDMSFQHCLEMSNSYAYKEDDKTYIACQTVHGLKTLKASAITKRYQRADISELWISLSKWRSYIPLQTEVHKAPKTSAFQWVSNSIKSLMTTLLRYEGELSPNSLAGAFLRTDEELYKDKGVTLIDNAYERTIDYLDNRKNFVNRDGTMYPVDKLLHLHMDTYVQGIVLNLYDDTRWSELRSNKLLKSFCKIASHKVAA